MNPNIKQLEALYWAGRLGSFQAAADRLHTTQSAISKRISELEETLGRKLFDRSRRNAVLTPAGERASDGAEQMLSIARELADDLETAPPYDVTFRLACTELIGLTWLPALLRRIRSEHERVRVEVEIHGGNTLLEQLNRGRYDLALLPGPMWGRLYEALPLKVLERAWMASPAMGIPTRVLTLEELAMYPIAAQYPDSIHAQLQQANLVPGSVPLHNVVQAHSFGVTGALACAGVAIANLPVSFYQPELRRKELVRLRVTPDLPEVEYFAVYRRGAAHRLAAQVARLAQSTCDFGSTHRSPQRA